MNVRALHLSLLVGAACLTAPTTVAQSFTKITGGPLVEDRFASIACSWGDYDQDGDQDLFVANGDLAAQANCLYRNEGPAMGYAFVKVTEGPVASDRGASRSASWGDCDNDGDLDLYVVNMFGTPNFFYLNKGDGTFAKVTQGDLFASLDWPLFACWIDYTNDGLLDLFVGNSGGANLLCRGSGGGTFTKITGQSVVTDGGTLGMCWGDFDRDGDADLFLARVDGNNSIYLNNGEGTFTKPAIGTFVPDWPTDSGGNAGGNWVDYDNDGNLDLFVDTWPETNRRNSLYRNEGRPGHRTFTTITEGDLVNDERIGTYSSWADFDNDGDLDCLVATVNPPQRYTNCLYANNGDRKFSKVTTGAILTDVGASGGSAWADYDNDGDMDLFVCNGSGEGNYLYRNDNSNGNHWLKVQLVGKASNASGIGATIRVQAAVNTAPVWQMRVVEGQSSAYGQNSLIAHFGLGSASMAEVVKIEWPSGITQVLQDVAVDQLLTVEEDPIPTVALSFSEGGGTKTMNLGALAGSGEITQREGFPAYSANVPAGAWAPPNNNASIDFGVIAEGQGGRAIDLGNTLLTLDAFTITGWLNARDLRAGAGGNRLVFALASPNGPGLELVQQSDGSLQLGVNQWAEGSPARSSVGRVTEDPAAAPGNWVFFAVTYDGTQPLGNARFFFGTTEEAAQADSGALDYDRGVAQPPGPLSVGNFSKVVAERNGTGPGGSRVFRGLLDEIEIYRRILSLDEIQEVQKAPAPRATVEPQLTISRDGMELIMWWEAARTFQVQRCTDLRGGRWFIHPATPEVDGFRHTLRQPISSTPQLFFRLSGY